MKRLLITCGAALCAAGTLAAGVGADPAAGTITIKIKVTGAITYSGTWKNAIDAKQTIPARYSCVRFTKPSFPVKGRPLAYNVSFANHFLLQRKAPALFFAFYYNPSKLGRPQPVHGIQGGANLLVVPKRDQTYGIQDITQVKIDVTLAKDYRSGSFTAQGLGGVLPTSGKVTVTGSWSCTGVYTRAT